MIIFDIDDSLTYAWQTEFLPGVTEILAALPTGTKIALATNQGAPACRDAGWGEKYASLSQVESRLAIIQAQIAAITGDMPALYVSLSYLTRTGDFILPAGLDSDDPRARADWRKPAPGMLLQAMKDAGASAADTLMIGDSDSDRLAAEAVGVEFQWANEFFAQK